MPAGIMYNQDRSRANTEDSSAVPTIQEVVARGKALLEADEGGEYGMFDDRQC